MRRFVIGLAMAVAAAAPASEESPKRDEAVKPSQSQEVLAADIIRWDLADAKASGRIKVDETRPERPVVGVVFESYRATDVSFARLVDLPELESLEVERCPGGGFGTSPFCEVTDAGLARLGRLKKLRSIELPEPFQVSDVGLESLARMTRLEKLTIGKTPWPGMPLFNTRFGVSANAPRSRDRESLVSGNSVTDAGVELLAKGTHLKELYISGDGLTDAGVELLAKGARLKRLYIAGDGLTDAGLRGLAAMKTLESLGFNSSRVSGNGLEILGELPRLRRLELCLGGRDGKPVGLGPGSLVHLRGLKNLRELSIDDYAYPSDLDSGLGALKELRELESLSIWSSSVTDAGLKPIGELKRLKRLKLVHFMAPLPATDAGLIHLAGLKRLEEIDLRGTEVTKAGFAELRRMFPGAKVLEGHLLDRERAGVAQ